MAADERKHGTPERGGTRARSDRRVGEAGGDLEKASGDPRRRTDEKRPPPSADEQRSAEVLDDPDNLAFQ